jgi:hypothetical protein
MSEITQEAIDLFTEQFDTAEEIQDLAAALLSPVEFTDGELSDLKTERWVDTAVGIQLDLIGAQVGEARKGRDDDAYRAAINFRIFINVSKTEPETIIRATRVLSGGDFIRYWENYPAGYQIFTNGPNVLDVSGAVVNTYLISLDDNGLLELDDGSNLLSRTSNSPPESLVGLLKDISPVAINYIALSFSLGETPLFGFAGDFLSTFLVTDDGGNFELDNGATLDVFGGEVGELEDGFEGFAEMMLQTFVLDDLGELYISSNIIDPINTGVLLEGILDEQDGRIQLNMLETQLADLVVTEVAVEDGGLAVRPEEDLIVNIGGTEYQFVTDDTSPLIVLPEEVVLATLLTDDGGIMYFNDSSAQAQFPFLTDDGGAYQISEVRPDDQPAAFETDDGGLLELDDGSTLDVKIVELEQILFESTNGSGILLDDGGLLELLAPIIPILENYLVASDGAEIATPVYEQLPGAGLLTLDDGAEFELNIFAVLDDPGPLAVFDQNQTPDGGGKLCESMTDEFAQLGSI